MLVLNATFTLIASMPNIYESFQRIIINSLSYKLKTTNTIDPYTIDKDIRISKLIRRRTNRSPSLLDGQYVFQSSRIKNLLQNPTE